MHLFGFIVCVCRRKKSSLCRLKINHAPGPESSVYSAHSIEQLHHPPAVKIWLQQDQWFHMFICLLLCLFVCLLYLLTVCLTVHLFIQICLLIYLSVRLSPLLSVVLSVHLLLHCLFIILFYVQTAHLLVHLSRVTLEAFKDLMTRFWTRDLSIYNPSFFQARQTDHAKIFPRNYLVS